MARRGDGAWAFQLAKKRKPTGRWTITVVDFLRELQKVGFDWSPGQANEYIQYYQYTWRLLEEGDYGLNTYYKYNMNE
ncbi:DNA polymerase V [Serratia ureilytica]|uniref:DNA polymerase V n=1 Tax=Serratia ureilytica TaxID=300181 RepID=UPI003D041A33